MKRMVESIFVCLVGNYSDQIIALIHGFLSSDIPPFGMLSSDEMDTLVEYLKGVK